ncbi:MAG: hypothetical protein HKN87_20515 [Saprospiraceae bacterium]|nr:hypothetical protein [Saprospiraceae bacterium]
MIFFAHQWSFLAFAKLFLFFLLKIDRTAPSGVASGNQSDETVSLSKDADALNWQTIDDLRLYGEHGPRISTGK